MLYAHLMRVHLVQLDIQWEDAPANRGRVESLMKAAGVAPGDLVLLPEMFDTGFSFNTERTADVRHESRDFVAHLARSYGVSVVAGITAAAREAGARARNRALVADPAGHIVAQYDKRHLFPLGEPSEAGRLEAGSELTLFNWAGLELCPLICYDLRFPELFAAGLARGAQGFCLVANWPSVRAGHWRALLIARAIENQAFVFAVNRVGRDPRLSYAGGSMVIDPFGEIALESDEREGVTSASVDPAKVVEWRRQFPAWRERLGVASYQADVR